MTQVLTEQQQRCHQTFKISSYAEQKDINPERVRGTCQWALSSSEFVHWQQSCCDDLLWISADPGCGKSVLAKSIVDNFVKANASDTEVVTCYFFFKDNDEQNRLSIALCSILHQLFSQRPDLLHHALPSWSRNGDSLRQEVQELWQILLVASSAKESCKIICIFDALDECREVDQNRFIEKLESFYTQSSKPKSNTWLKFLVTSRPYDHIQNGFKPVEDLFPCVHLKGEKENHQIHKEIDLVVKLRVKELAKVAQLSCEIQRKIEDQLLRMKHRTYLWLHLAIDDIRNTFENSLLPEKESIELIPPNVNAAYEKILSRVPSTQVDTARNVLQIIVGARRPLTVKEMAIALGTTLSPQSTTVTQASLDPDHLGEKLRRLCGLFVFISNTKIYLIHQTAREFLIKADSDSHSGSKYSCSLYDTERNMAIICLRYLLMDDWVQERVRNSDNPEFLDLEDFLGDDMDFEDEDIYREKENQWLEQQQEISPIQIFANYSAIYWPDHVRELSLVVDQEMKDLLIQIYNTTTDRFSVWFRILWKSLRPVELIPSMNAVQLAAFNGHVEVILHLLAEDIDSIETPDTEGNYPLVWASLFGHLKAVKLLLDKGAEVNLQGGLHDTALRAACSEGHEDIVELLLKHKADVNAQHASVLQSACSGGHESIVNMLLDHGADVNAHNGSALQSACYAGHGSIVQMLLNYGADINAQGELPLGDPLIAACSEGHADVVEILLEKGVGLDHQGVEAMHKACCKGYERIVQILLNNGVEVNAKFESQGSFLNAACNEGNEKIVKMLLDNGAHAKNGDGLLSACVQGYEGIVRMLLDHGADANAKEGLCLQFALDGEYQNIVEMLLESGAKKGSQGRPGDNAIQSVEEESHGSVGQTIKGENSIPAGPPVRHTPACARKRRHS